MTWHHRLDDIIPNEKAPSLIDQHGTQYIRCEYFEDGQRVYFSILDFVLNGPLEGDIATRKEINNGCEHSLKVLTKHYEGDDIIPCMIEVELTTTIDNQTVIKDKKLWVIVKDTETTREKFRLDTRLGVRGNPFALVPDFLVKKHMNQLSTNNDVTVAFSVITGIPKETLVLPDRV
jgi:hypothetical protein